MALMIVGLMVGTAAASDWEIEGGMSITNVTLDKWNATIDGLNKTVFNDASPVINNAEKMDNIERVPMLYLGTSKKLNENWGASFRYEYIFGGVEGSSNVGGEAHSAENDVKLNGVSALLNYELNKNWSLGGGIGLYKGTKTQTLEGSQLVGVPGVEVEKEIDLDAASYRLGVGYERAFASNWSFNAGLDYLYMEIDDEDEGNVYSKGFSYNAGVTYSF
jgi:opacity protein-like surface antigen